MSVLEEQHERWTEARARLWASAPVEAAAVKRAVKTVPVNPFKRIQRQRNIDMVAKAVRNKPDLAVIFPDIFAHVEAGYLPSAVIYMAGVRPPDSMPRWKVIAMEVAAKHRVRFSDMLSVRRTRAAVAARQEAFWRCREETSMSLPAIGRMFGGRDHTTVMHGIRKYEMRREMESGDSPQSPAHQGVANVIHR